jgi:CheY-like chemotaxis protein
MHYNQGADCSPLAQCHSTGAKGNFMQLATPQPAGGSVELLGERPRRVIILDDNEDVADILHDLLTVLGYDVSCHYSASAAIADITAFNPDVCISDLDMPKMNGFEFARAARAIPHSCHLLLIAHSGYDSPACQQAAFEAGFDKYLSKSASIESIIQSIGPSRFFSRD